jgi:hypothetical protein
MDLDQKIGGKEGNWILGDPPTQYYFILLEPEQPTKMIECLLSIKLEESVGMNSWIEESNRTIHIFPLSIFQEF